MAGQTINDRLLAARHSIAGQGLAKSVCKATTEEMIGPKKKHLDFYVYKFEEPLLREKEGHNLAARIHDKGKVVDVSTCRAGGEGVACSDLRRSRAHCRFAVDSRQRGYARYSVA